MTCAEGTPEAKLPYCDRSMGFAARSADLVARLNQTDQQNLFFSYTGTPYISKTNSKGWSLDHTCIHGLNKQNGVTVFPHVRLHTALHACTLCLEARTSRITVALVCCSSRLLHRARLGPVTS